MQGIGSPNQSDGQTHALAVSADGSVTVGYGTGPAGAQALRWIATKSVQSVQDWLDAAGGDTTGWSFQSALGVSGDGNVVVEYGMHAGKHEAYIAEVCHSPNVTGMKDLNANVVADVTAQPLVVHGRSEQRH